jgi:hypothetical protein
LSLSLYVGRFQKGVEYTKRSQDTDKYPDLFLYWRRR